jgi:hypothetical protein
MLTEHHSERKFTNIKARNFFPFYLENKKKFPTFASSNNKTTKCYGQEFYENDERKSHEGNY